MRAVILAGGLGTRLRPYTTVIPKPLVPIGDRPIVEVIIRQLTRSGFTRIDMCVSHLGELIQAYFADAARLPGGVELDYHFEDTLLGTAGALGQIADLDQTFLVINGDILTDLDFAALMRFHAAEGAALTLASHRRGVRVDLGVIESDGRAVTGYVEKPMLHYEASMGVYVYDRSALQHIPAGRFDFPDLVTALIQAGERVVAYPFDGKWFDIGTRADHEAAVSEFEAHPELFDDV
jgi:NDP-sugar pyrophosphorylase family protein